MSDFFCTFAQILRKEKQMKDYQLTSDGLIIDDVKTALANDGHIDLNRMEWTHDIEGNPKLQQAYELGKSIK